MHSIQEGQEHEVFSREYERGMMNLSDSGITGDKGFQVDTSLGAEGSDDASQSSVNFNVLHASQTFTASLEGQVCVLKGDSLQMIDDSNSYWWLVRCVKTDEVGYIPAEIVETPLERLARINKNLNMTLSQVRDDDLYSKPERVSLTLNKCRSVVFDKNVIRYIGSSSPQKEYYSKQGIEGKSALNKFFWYLKGKKSQSAGKLRCKEQEDLSLYDSRQALSDKPESELITVLRVYSGNADLEATFKTVNFDRNMTAKELLKVVLQRFKVSNPENLSLYYLGILYMDSQEKRLKDTDVVFDVFQELSSKNLPGVSNSSASFNHIFSRHGSISSIAANDDNIIKVIVNKEDTISSEIVLLRVYVRRESMAQIENNVYKTLALKKNLSVDDAISNALKKFRVQRTGGFSYSLFQKLGGQEIELMEDETMDSVSKRIKSTADNLFILSIKWIGEGIPPEDNFAASNTAKDGTSLDVYIDDILKVRPKFLEKDKKCEGDFNSESELINGSEVKSELYNDKLSELDNSHSEVRHSYTESTFLNDMNPVTSQDTSSEHCDPLTQKESIQNTALFSRQDAGLNSSPESKEIAELTGQKSTKNETNDLNSKCEKLSDTRSAHLKASKLDIDILIGSGFVDYELDNDTSDASPECELQFANENTWNTHNPLQFADFSKDNRSSSNSGTQIHRKSSTQNDDLSGSLKPPVRKDSNSAWFTGPRDIDRQKKISSLTSSQEGVAKLNQFIDNIDASEINIDNTDIDINVDNTSKFISNMNPNIYTGSIIEDSYKQKPIKKMDVGLRVAPVDNSAKT